MAKRKWRTFTLGTILGSMLIGGIGYVSAEEFNIDVLFPKAAYSVDGKPITEKVVTIKHDDDYYIPLQRFEAGLYNINGQSPESQKAEQVTFEQVQVDEAPIVIQKWVERSLDLTFGQVYRYDGYTYILVTRGMQPSGGYSTTIGSIDQNEWGTWVRTVERDPSSEQFVTAEVTYPYDLVRTPVEFESHVYFINDTGDSIPSLPGISYLHSFANRSNNIILFEPLVTEDAVTIHGIIRSLNDVAFISLSGDRKKEWIELNEGDWSYFSKTVWKENVRPVTVTTFDENGKQEKLQLNLPENGLY